jgi:hypothetical protein
MKRRWHWPENAVHRLDIHATPEQWQAWNAAARLSGVPIQVWLTHAGDAHARDLQRASKREGLEMGRESSKRLP